MYRVNTGDGSRLIPVDRVQQIILSRSTSVSFDALETAIHNGCDVILQHPNGKPIGRVWSNRFGSVASIRKNQYVFAGSPEGAALIRKLILMKMDNMLSLLMMFDIIDNLWHDEVKKAQKAIENARCATAETAFTDIADFFASLRGFEGNAAKHYFKAINAFLPEAFRFAGRSRHPATDRFNALLNYAYGMLYAKVEWAIIKAGLDPFVGIMHRDEYNKPVLTYDLIEPFRVWADYIVIELCRQEIPFAEFFEILPDGEHRLLTDIKRILAATFNDYLADVCNINGVSRSRNVHMELFAQKLAADIKKYQGNCSNYNL
jgi:CRISPR-associated protein Cas1